MHMCVILNGDEIQLFEHPDVTALDFCFWGCMKSEVTAPWMLLPAHINVQINSDEQHAIIVHELRSALRLTVGFSNIYCEL